MEYTVTLPAAAVVAVAVVMLVLLWIGMKITGALIGAVFWLVIRVPLTLIIWALGLVLCCTLLLIPVGGWLLKCGLKILLP